MIVPILFYVYSVAAPYPPNSYYSSIIVSSSLFSLRQPLLVTQNPHFSLMPKGANKYLKSGCPVHPLGSEWSKDLPCHTVAAQMSPDDLLESGPHSHCWSLCGLPDQLLYYLGSWLWNVECSSGVPGSTENPQIFNIVDMPLPLFLEQFLYGLQEVTLFFSAEIIFPILNSQNTLMPPHVFKEKKNNKTFPTNLWSRNMCGKRNNKNPKITRSHPLESMSMIGG